MKKRIASLLMAMLMVFTLLPVQALAEELDAAEPAAVQEEPLPTTSVDEQQEVTITEEPSLLDAETGSGTGGLYTGTLGENVSWSLDTGTGALTVTGSGAMEDYSSEESPLWNYRSYIKSVIIADTVATVGSCVFRGCTNLTAIDLGGVTKIGGYAFYECKALTSIVIPDSVTSIGGLAFYDCDALMEIVIPDSVTTIGDSAFFSCDNLTSVTMGSGVTSIGSSAFYNCGLTEIVIPDSVTSIGSGAFQWCSSLTEVVIPGSVTSIGGCAFECCEALTEIVLPDNITSIGSYAFQYCSSLAEIVIPDSVTSIGDSAFAFCYALTSVTMGSGVISIGSSAFEYCTSLAEILIPDSVTSIGKEAFRYCSSLASAEFLGDAPTTFGREVFGGGSSNFTVFYHSGTTGWTSPTWNGYNAVCRDKSTTDFSTLDDSSRNGQGIYFQLNATSMTATVGVGTTASNNAGYDGGQNGSIVIPDTVTKDGKTYNVIGVNQFAFANCFWVNTIAIGRYVSAIEPSAFRGCKNLTAITVDANNLQFADQDGVLFDKCGLYLYAYPAGRAAATYDIPDTCDTVGTQSFYGAENLTSLTVPGSVKNIGAGAFAQCNTLEELVLPFLGSNVDDDETFDYVFVINYRGGVPQSLKTVTVLTANLVGGAFYDCAYIENIYLPNCAGLTKIPDSCFFGCTALQTLVFGGDKTDAYSGVRIPDTVTTIDYGAFYNCKSLTSITLGAGVNYISSLAFSSCSGLTRFSVVSGNTAFTADEWGVLYSKDMSVLRYYPSARPWPYYNVAESATAIAENAFTYCDKLVNLFIPKTVTRFGVYQRNYNGVLNYEGSSTSGISNCPNTTVCCYMDSAAARYAINNSLAWWYMDNYDMQGIKVTGLPEYTVVNTQGQVLSCSAYVTAQYGDKELQLDDYTIQPVSGYGEQTLTFSSGGFTATATANVIRQGNVNGAVTAQGDIDAGDMQCLYTYLTTGENEGQIKDAEVFALAADANGDGKADVYDLQRLYEAVSGINEF